MVRTLALAVAAAWLAALVPVHAKDEARSKVLRPADWNPGVREGRCQLRVWVDERALVQLRGEELWIRTETGEAAYDQGSSCNQPLPFRRIDDFRVNADRGRGGIENVQRPGRRNNYTGSVIVNDPQPGGALYLIDISWSSAGEVRAVHREGTDARDLFPVYDELRACQDKLRAEFLRRNRGDAYLEFTGLPERDEIGRGRDRVTGTAYARNRSVTRSMKYECVLNERTQAVESVAFRYPIANGDSVR